MKEICVGLTIGFTASFLFNAILFAGRLLDTEMGFTIVEIIDPMTDVLTTVTSQFKILVFSTLFLLLNGHYFLILAVEKSFDVIPIGGAVFRAGDISQLITKMVNDIFILGIRFAAPVYVVLLLSSLALGIIARTVPQLNVFFVGMPIKIILGLATLAIALPTLVIIFQDIFTIFLKDLWKLLFLMA
jgi:flagellar biosynthetic protein FliR